MLKKLFLLVIISITIFGCAGVPNQMSYVTPTFNKQDNNAKIVFYRPTNFVGSAVPTTIVEVLNSEKIAYVGELYSGNGIIYSVKPGKHVFGVSGESWKSVTIYAYKSKFYYIHISPTPGFWYANFKPMPISKENMKYLDNIDQIKWTSPNDNATKLLDQKALSYMKAWENAIKADRIIGIPADFGLGNHIQK